MARHTHPSGSDRKERDAFGGADGGMDGWMEAQDGTAGPMNPGILFGSFPHPASSIVQSRKRAGGEVIPSSPML
jgi:hypothetical protein